MDATETPLHIMASPASVGTTLFDAGAADFVGPAMLLGGGVADLVAGAAVLVAGVTTGEDGSTSFPSFAGTDFVAGGGLYKLKYLELQSSHKY